VCPIFHVRRECYTGCKKVKMSDTDDEDQYREGKSHHVCSFPESEVVR